MVKAISSFAARRTSKSTGDFKVPPSDFIDQFYAHLLPADLELFTRDERARLAASIWRLAALRKKGTDKIRVFNPSPDSDGWTVDHTVIEIVQDDMPFLVDSVTGVLQRAGYAIHLVVHPILRVRRDNKGHLLGLAGEKGDFLEESFMHIQIDHCLDNEGLKHIEDELTATLLDVRAAVRDWRKMRDCMDSISADIKLPGKVPQSNADMNETHAFLRWLCDDNFTFLGYREVDLQQDHGYVSGIHVVPGKGLGILRNDDVRMFGGLRDLDEKRRPALRKYARQRDVMFVTKTDAVTRVHRIVPMDAVFIRSFDESGTVIHEKLFVGLFTSQTYAQPPDQIPFLRRKIANILTQLGFPPDSHDGRSLIHILNTYPHDELFQIQEPELRHTALGILQLQERARVALFARRDPFERYVTCLIYVPRDRYDSDLRVRIQAFLQAAYAGQALSWNVRIDDSRLARAFVTVQLTPSSLKPDATALEAELRDMCRTWSDRLRDSLAESYGEAAALALLRRYGDAFPETYRDAISTSRAVQDIRELERLRVSPHFSVTLNESLDGRLQIKLFQPERPLKLSEVLPLLENMGLKIDYMGGPYAITFKDGAPALYIHEFVGQGEAPSKVAFDLVKPVFEEALTRIWAGDAENDSFNALTYRIGLEWRAVMVLRAFARYLRQLRVPYSQTMIADALLTYPHIAQMIYANFYACHAPEHLLRGSRGAECKRIRDEILDALTEVTVLDDDRVIRRYLNLVEASLRTNYFQTDAMGKTKPYLSIKFDSRAVDFMPLPKPQYEIFVYSPQTEAVHLRGGKVARGGIRWSDRREDFRAEILGLMKAQMVKNSVIVPVGSKGGFIVKRPPADAEKFQAEGIACYKIMMRGLLDLTDNLVKGKIVPPPHVVRHDYDDPYLVVAADKGTAKFSDIANALSQDYGFWLDDAFASGGSAGYDHKGMGITARGAWEAVKRHFREMGKDIQKENFTCIGVGDMSGDVFGNGMLLSPFTLLIGAFDHRHIFCDPTPHAAESFQERKRMFALPRSSWADYGRDKISKGGGVYARSEKTIKITPEMKKAYGLTADTLAPTDLIQAMLKATTELLYFGGIGTYVKANDETHEEVGDRANEALRVNAHDVRAKIIAEGANLGMTQRGRIEYALHGGRLNTDAIDNSAGVDTSDHEVNIKILLRKAVDRKKLTLAERNKLLASMTSEVGHLVLRDNYLQTQALSLAEAQAVDLLPMHIAAIQMLEKSGLLNRKVEFLPDDAEIAERQRLGRGLMRPELAVLLSYAKIWLYQKILESNLPDNKAVRKDVVAYFPQALRKVYASDIAGHQLMREIAATVLTNDIINRTGIHSFLTLSERVEVESIASAYVIAREALAVETLWDQIELLDGKAEAGAQVGMLLTVQGALVQAMERLSGEKNTLADLARSIAASAKGVTQLNAWLGKHHAALDTQFHHKIAAWRAHGVPESLAQRVAHFTTLVSAYGLIELATTSKRAVEELATIFFGLEKRLDIGWLNRLAQGSGKMPWQRQAAAAALEGLSTHHRRLTAELVAHKSKHSHHEIMKAWGERHKASLARYDAMIAEWHAAGAVDISMLLLANEMLSTLSG